MRDRALVRVKVRVEDQSAKRRIVLARGRRDALDDGVEDLLNAHARLRRSQDRLRRVEADRLLDLLLDALRIGARQVDLVDDRDDFEIVLQRHVDVRERLRFDALRRIDDEKSSLAGCKASRHLVCEIDVTRRVDEIEFIDLAVLAAIVQAHGLRLDRNAALALKLHVVEHLRLHLALSQSARAFNEAVGKRRLAMVDVRDNREIADVFVLHQKFLSLSIGSLTFLRGEPLPMTKMPSVMPAPHSSSRWRRRSAFGSKLAR